MEHLRVRGGSVLGHSHKLYEKNRQDAYEIRDLKVTGKQIVIGVLSDGCGSGKASEVGANLLVRFIANFIEGELARVKNPGIFSLRRCSVSLRLPKNRLSFMPAMGLSLPARNLTRLTKKISLNI